MSQDAGGEAKTIACPKCGEKNMAVDVRCWACDAELHPAPAPHEPADPGDQDPHSQVLGD